MATAAMLLGSMVLLFAQLGTYSLWTDEAVTAITAAGVWRTGDTSAWLDDHNLLTYRNGLLLKDQRDRYTSPLQFYLAAPFIGLLGHTSFAARLPFALCGMGTVLILLRWLRASKPSSLGWISAILILLTNASFFLFQRQCRYFALTTFLTTLVAYLYCHRNGTRRQLLGTGIAMSLLLASQYLDYAAVVACLLVDYGIWGRRSRAIRGINWLVLILPQIVVACVVCPIWNPIARATEAVAPAVASGHVSAIISASQPWIADYLRLIWWNLRDLLACDFVVLPLLAICPVLYLARKNAWLLRAPLAFLIFVSAIAFFTSHALTPQGNAEVRYLAPMLPLCIAIGILAVTGMQSTPVWVRCVLLSIAGVSIFLQGAAISFYRELLSPSVEPYAPVAAFINQTIPSRATVYVTPDMCVGPVMWNASKATYVWQVNDPPRADYRSLPEIYFKGRIAPDYLIAFGPFDDEVQHWRTELAKRGVEYEPMATIPVYYKEMYRPEMIWRSFSTIAPVAGESVLIYRLSKPIAH